jgi:hypothetical protein
MSQEPVFIGLFAGAVRWGWAAGQHKKAERGFSQKFHAAKSPDQVEEPEAGRMVQTQVINLVNGVVTRRLAATDATSDRVGACGAKLLERAL